MAGQQEFDTPQAALAHYGVKGMRWGHRRSEEELRREHAIVTQERKANQHAREANQLKREVNTSRRKEKKFAKAEEKFAKAETEFAKLDAEYKALLTPEAVRKTTSIGKKATAALLVTSGAVAVAAISSQSSSKSGPSKSQYDVDTAIKNSLLLAGYIPSDGVVKVRV